eukprot:gb/GEZN01016499.1/.p1 GENE.gb/GEZN01016499.1/~~gb/GEZN01016499.1/.p1  ORF type:complete len:182 (-),score=31.05 gb/GEZN01016499.1/:220-765(-)
MAEEELERCKRVVCKDDPVADLLQDLHSGGDGAHSGKKKAAGALSTEAPSPFPPYPVQPPPSLTTLGQSGWTLLHSMAAYYPDTPSQQDRKQMSSFLHGVARFFPCEFCALHMQEWCHEQPPEHAVSSRENLSVWMCKLHNDVNRNKRKPEFPCTLRQLDMRWRDGVPDLTTLKKGHQTSK